ncbi:hypothetical protein Syun_009110 [Stephania yunnanensis]|uniref:Uncharacterized protein n=1 Tax=Stephania yunnanensis TaxID=152371 RepID=A0AAP0KDS7_9MAGN
MSFSQLSFSLVALWSLSLSLSLLTASNRLSALSPVSGHRSLLSPVTAISSVISAHRSLLSLSHRSLLSARSVLTAPLTALYSSRTFSLSLSPLSLTEISIPNPKSLASLRLQLRRGRRLCRRRLPEIGASEALSRRRPTPPPGRRRTSQDGVITVLTTGLSDEEIYQYCLNLKEHVTSRRSTSLPSRSKHGQKFSGTEITFSLTSIDWKSFGLNAKSSAIDEDSDAVLEWENWPPLVHISHCKAAPDLIYGCVPPLLLSILS